MHVLVLGLIALWAVVADATPLTARAPPKFHSLRPANNLEICVEAPIIGDFPAYQIVLWECNGNVQQRVRIDPSFFNQFQLWPFERNWCVRNVRGIPTNGDPVITTVCDLRSPQAWTWDGYLLKTRGLCLDRGLLPDRGNGQTLRLWTCDSNNPNQQWILIPEYY